MSDNAIVARPYAKAVFEYARENNSFSQWGDFLQVLALMAKNSKVIAAIKSPKVTTTTIVSELLAISQKLAQKPTPAMENFVKIVAENDRLLALPEIAFFFEKFRRDFEKTIEVQVQSFMPFSDSQKQRLQAALEKRFDRKATLTFTVEPALLGGALVKAGDSIIDGSVRGKLVRLFNHLKVKERQ